MLLNQRNVDTADTFTVCVGICLIKGNKKQNILADGCVPLKKHS